MKKWLTSVFLVLALANGVLAGTSLFTSNSERGMSAMECCKKKKMSANNVSASQLCCAINCNNPAPTAPGAAYDFSPSSINVSDSIIKQIALLLKREKSVSTVFPLPERKIFSQKFQPKYIQHHSFLI
jgi:hypothetical protein